MDDDVFDSEIDEVTAFKMLAENELNERSNKFSKVNSLSKNS